MAFFWHPELPLARHGEIDVGQDNAALYLERRAVARFSRRVRPLALEPTGFEVDGKLAIEDDGGVKFEGPTNFKLAIASGDRVTGSMSELLRRQPAPLKARATSHPSLSFQGD